MSPWPLFTFMTMEICEDCKQEQVVTLPHCNAAEAGPGKNKTRTDGSRCRAEPKPKRNLTGSPRERGSDTPLTGSTPFQHKCPHYYLQSLSDIVGKVHMSKTGQTHENYLNFYGECFRPSLMQHGRASVHAQTYTSSRFNILKDIWYVTGINCNKIRSQTLTLIFDPPTRPAQSVFSMFFKKCAVLCCLSSPAVQRTVGRRHDGWHTAKCVPHLFYCIWRPCVKNVPLNSEFWHLLRNRNDGIVKEKV